MTLAIRRSDLHLVDLRTRMPFRYGIATMTEMPLAFVQLHVRIDHRDYCGVASDLLPPKWFTKVPEKSPAEEIEEMLQVIRNALRVAEEIRASSLFDAWHQIYSLQDQWAAAASLPPLLAHFGTSLVERALIEAICRAEQRSFHALLYHDQLGIDLGQIHPILNGFNPSQLLPKSPLPAVIARHTVGLADPLTDSDVDTPLDDGLPQSLESCIRHYRLRHFKIKVNGQLDQDIERLSRVAATIQARATPDYAFTLDGNEQFASFDDFRTFWNAVRSRKPLADFLQHLLFVEQPLRRDRALRPDVQHELSSWKDHPPLIIDESDGTLDAARTALALGYNGTSHKNCKGVIKGIVNRCLISKLNLDDPARTRLMSGEDLCNIGPVALLQDLAVMAALGIESVERNGHHYNAGLSQLPRSAQALVLTHHPDLYHPSPHGWPTLSIHNGVISLDSVNRSPFGVNFQLPLPL